MGEKIWIIGEQELDAVPKKGRPKDPVAETGAKGNTAHLDESQKNPALSFSLSMLVWGGGHLFIGQWRPGLIYLGAMALFYGLLSAAAIYRDVLAHFLSERPGVMVAVLALFLSGLMFWMFSAVDAYYRTLRSRSEPFLGVERKLWAFGGSLLFPGWGQFLNSQSRKGMVFLSFGAAGIFSLFAMFVVAEVWPLLPWDESLHFYERFLVGALLLVPVVFIMWLVSIYDAFRSCENFLRYKQRSKMAGKRFRGKGFLRDLVPQTSTVLGFLLAVSLGMQFFPKEQYLVFLDQVHIEMINSHMTIIPEWIHKAIELLS